MKAADNFREFIQERKFTTILADPPWSFAKGFVPYPVMKTKDIMEIPVNDAATENAHLYLWVCNSNIAEGLEVMKAWGFTYKSYIVWVKTTLNGEPDRGSLGFNFRNATELILFGKKGSLATLLPARSTSNVLQVRRRENSRKPEELYMLIEKCSPGPYLELFARGGRKEWHAWGNQSEEYNHASYKTLLANNYNEMNHLFNRNSPEWFYDNDYSQMCLF